jgi:hypothetical protein
MYAIPFTQQGCEGRRTNGKAVRKPRKTVRSMALGTFLLGDGSSSARCVAASIAPYVNIAFAAPMKNPRPVFQPDRGVALFQTKELEEKPPLWQARMVMKTTKNPARHK